MCIVIVLLIKLLFVGHFSCNCPRGVLKLAKEWRSQKLTQFATKCHRISTVLYVTWLFCSGDDSSYSSKVFMPSNVWQIWGIWFFCQIAKSPLLDSWNNLRKNSKNKWLSDYPSINLKRILLCFTVFTKSCLNKRGVGWILAESLSRVCKTMHMENSPNLGVYGWSYM